MECTRDAVRKAARQLGRLTPAPENVGELLVAPSDEEEQLSQSTLALAPSVAVLAKQVKAKIIRRDPTRRAQPIREATMSTATLRFQLPEEEHEYRRAMLGDLAIQTLWHVDQHCRGAVKHGDVSQETARLLQQIREMIPGELLDA
jgi:hypothetical protein